MGGYERVTGHSQEPLGKGNMGRNLELRTSKMHFNAMITVKRRGRTVWCIPVHGGEAQAEPMQ